MNGFRVKLVLLLARAIAIAYALYFLTFSFSVFGGGQPFGTALTEFAIHAAPAFLVAFIVSISWKRARLAGILMLSCAVLFTILFYAYRTWGAAALFSAPPAISGALFLLEARKRKSSA